MTQELLLIDQCLATIQDAWKADSDQVDLAAWKQKLPAPMSVADDFFIADDAHIIRQDVLPHAVGQGVGAPYVTFPHGSLEVFGTEGVKATESMLLQMKAGDPIDARAYPMYVVRPLDHPRGWLVGASYRSAELTRMFGRASLGYNALVALVDTRQGMLQAVVGPAARRPTTDLGKTPMYAALRRAEPGIWMGKSGIDDVERLHAFRMIPGRDMAILVAASYAEVMTPANNLAVATHAVAVVATGLVAAVASLVAYTLYMFRAKCRRQRRATRQTAELERLGAAETVNLARAQVRTAQLQALLDYRSDGVALVDPELRVAQWNRRFVRGIGVILREGLPLDEMIRAQAAHTLFDPGADPEVEIARRVAALRLGVAGLPQFGPDGESLFLRGMPVTEGGFLLILSGFSGTLPLDIGSVEAAAELVSDRREA